MRIATKIVIDSETLEVLAREDYSYDGPVELCKGATQAQTQSQQASLQAQQQQNAFNTQLMSIFQQQFGQQQQVFNFLQNTLQPQVAAGGQGYTPAQLAALRTGASDTNAQQFQNAQQALNEVEAQHGGNDLPSGVNANLNASLAVQEAQTEAASQNQITQNNANLQQQNYWNALNALNGVGTEFNPIGYSGAATSGTGASSSAANAVSGAQNAITNANQSGFFGSLENGFGGALGKSLGGGNLGISMSF
jgi:hypothetical protein